jgi:hypothetical protein
VFRLADRVTVRLLEASATTGSTVFRLLDDAGREQPGRKPAPGPRGQGYRGRR